VILCIVLSHPFARKKAKGWGTEGSSQIGFATLKVRAEHLCPRWTHRVRPAPALFSWRGPREAAAAPQVLGAEVYQFGGLLAGAEN